MKRDAGFTVLEVLVALVILTLSLIALHRALGTAYSAARRVTLQDEAMAVGQSQLARIGNDLPVRPIALQGTLSHGSTWSLAVKEIAPASPTRLLRRFSVTYVAQDPSGTPLLQLRTFRIVGESKR